MNAARALFLLFVLANVAFFAWSRHIAPEPYATDRAPLERQISPEKLPAVPEATAQASPASQTTVAAESAGPSGSCMEWGGFTAENAALARKALEPLSLGDRLSVHSSEEPAGWWIFIPPQANRQAALKKAAELKALGVEEYFIVQDEGRLRWAVSLGVFRGEEAAQSRLATLRALGVRSAQVGRRETTVVKQWLQIRESPPEQRDRLRALVAEMPGTELRPCSPATGQSGT